MLAATTDDSDLNELTGRTRTAGATGRTLYVAPPGAEGLADFSSVADAIARAATLATGALGDYVTVLLAPGLYSEANPLAVPAGVSVVGAATFGTIVVGANTAAPVFTLVPQAQLQKLSVVLVGAPGVAAVEYDGSGGEGIYGVGSVGQVAILASDVGFRNLGGPNSFLVNESGAVASSAALTVATAFEGLAGSRTTVVNFLTRAFDLGGPAENLVGTAIRATGADALVQVVGAAIDGCATGVVADAGATVRVTAGAISNTATAIAATGASPSLEVTAVDVDDCGTDLDLSGASGTPDIRIVSTTLDDAKVNNPDHVPVSGIVFSSVESSVDVRGELHVGTPFAPATSSFGGGDSYNSGVVGLTNTNGEAGAWADVTPDMTSEGGSSFPVFPSAAAGATFYVGSDLPFGGIELSTGGTALDSADLGNVVWEYWEGTQWNPFAIMATQRAVPYASFANTALARASSVEQVRFGQDTDDVAATAALSVLVETTMVPKTLNGVEKFWVRVRVASALGGPVPLIEQVQAHAGRFEVNADGFTERFGGVVRTLPWDLGLLEAANDQPGNQDLYLGDSLNVGRVRNRFDAGVTDRSGFCTRLPEGVDTSKGVKISWSWSGSSDNTGDVRWVLRWSRTRDGDDVFYSTAQAPATAAGERSFVLTQNVPAGRRRTQLNTGPVYLDVSDYNARPETGEPDILWFTLEREGGADTYNGNAALVNVFAEYIEVFDGGHPELF